MIKEQRILKHSRKKKIESEAKKIEMESRWKPAKKGELMGGGWERASQSYIVFRWTQNSKEILGLCFSAISVMTTAGVEPL